MLHSAAVLMKTFMIFIWPKLFVIVLDDDVDHVYLRVFAELYCKFDQLLIVPHCIYLLTLVQLTFSSSYHALKDANSSSP